MNIKTVLNGAGGVLALSAGLALGGMASAHTKKPLKPGSERVSASGTALWQFPDKRALNAEIFGTPAAPMNVELLALDKRGVSADGTAYTTIKKPLMFSNKIKMTTGSFKMSVEDNSAKDGKNSKDKIAMEANFKGPKGRDFRVTMNKLITGGGEHPMFGGVGLGVLMHGGTGIGTPLVAQEFSYITAWGLGTVFIDGKKVDSKRVIHVMVSERMRDDNFKLGFGVAKPKQLEIHLAMPPLKGAPGGPVASAIPTGVMLPNGKEQPFMHVNFYGNIKLEGDRFFSARG